MNTVFALTRSTVLADARPRSTGARIHREAQDAPTVVHVGGLAMSPRTVVGHARTVLERALGPDRPSRNVRVGVPLNSGIFAAQEEPITTSTLHASTDSTGTTKVVVVPERHENGFVSAIGSTAAWVILGTMIAGPPAVGYLIAGKVGLFVGAVVAAPMALLFGLAVLGQLPRPQPS